LVNYPIYHPAESVIPQSHLGVACCGKPHSAGAKLLPGKRLKRCFGCSELVVTGYPNS
jgi:hypothetical protein